ncbi:MAG: PH domain-containing protein [Bacteroidota bacterium]|nr:PH domain-containing protein [Bacteroidota bacterium]
MKYAASLDKTSKIITLLVSLLFAVIIVSQIVSFIRYRDVTPLWVTGLLLIIYVITYCYHPVSYQIKNKSIVVHRYASNVVLSPNEIKHVEIIPSQKLRGSIRIFGVGGLYGYFGQFSNRDLGYMTWYATQRVNEVILIELNNHKKIIITPDQPQQFVDELTQIA